VRLGAVGAAAAAVACAAALLSAAPARADSNCVVTQDRSINSDNPSSIQFVNGSGRTVDIYWLNFNGEFEYQGVIGAPYNTLAPDQEYGQSTFLTHPWKALDSVTSACLGYTLSDTVEKTYVVQPPSGPQAFVAPGIQGTPSVGSQLTAIQGMYDDAITSYAYQWERCPDGVNTCTAIEGATGSTYIIQAADQGRELRVRESATNFLDQTTDAYSPLVGFVTAAPASADLEVSLACTTNCSPASGEEVVFTGLAKNNGPHPSSLVSVLVTPNATAGSYRFTVGDEQCDTTCNFDELAAGASLAVTVHVTVGEVAAFPATLQVTLSADAQTDDPAPANNTVTAEASIRSPAAASNVSVIVKPLTSEPGARQIPTANIDLAAIPDTPGATSSAPIASIPIASIPIASIPIASIPIASIGLTPELLDGIGGVPLSSLPLLTPGGWDAKLLGTPLAGAMLQTTTLADVFRRAPIALTGVQLQDLGLASSPIASIPIASIALGPVRLADIPLLGQTGSQNLSDWCTALRVAGFACDAATLALADGRNVGDATMASIGIEGAPIASIPIASVPIASIPIASIPIASIPIASIAVAGSPIASIPIASIAVAGSPIASIPIASIPIASIANIVDCTAYPCTGKTLGDARIADRILDSATLADLGDAILGSITLGELAAFFPPDITLGDVLAILAGPPSARGYERLPFTKLPAQNWATNGATAIYHVTFDLTGGLSPVGATVAVAVPAGFLYAGGAQLVEVHVAGDPSTSVPPEPTTDGNTLSFHLDELVPGDHFDLNFRLRPSLVLGPSGPASATVTPDSGGAPDSGSGGVLQVHDTFEPANNDPVAAPLLATDTIYLSYVTSATDTDSYRFPAPPAGSRVTVKLVPPTGADYDLSLYRPTRASVVSSPIASIPLDGQPVPDAGVPLTHASSSQAPETLSDIPIASIPLASVSDNRGDAEESATTVTQAGDDFLTIGVTGYQGSTSNEPYTLLVAVTPPPDLATCLPSPIVTTGNAPLGQLVAPASTPSTLNTLFVVDSRRLQAAYPGRAQAVLSSLSTLAGRADLGVTGAVLDVANDPDVLGAETAWDASPCSPGNANAVARAVSSVVARYTAARPGVKYVVLAGGDDQIPFFRLPDLTTVSNESDYAATFSEHPNQYFGALVSGDVLSDNPYGTSAPTPFFDRFLYVPSRSVGRLVESADDIVRAVNQFVSSAGTLNPTTALVTGYDFLADGSNQIAATETAQRGAANTKTLIDDPLAASPLPLWSAASLNTALGTSPASVLSLNAHYDHYRLLPSDGGALFASSQMAAKSLAGRFVFTMGCHAGLSVSDIVVGAADSRRLDWAQVYGAGGALYAAGTGYGYGDTTGVAYSEKLMSFLAKRMDGTLTAGDAMMIAKNDFKASLGPIGVYDEKVISETTFYGLPMYRVGAQVPLPPAPIPRPTTPDGLVGGGVEAADLTVSPTLTPKSSPFGSYYVSDDIISTNYRPVQPSTSADLTQSSLIAHGALITHLASTDHPNVDAAFSMPTIDRTASAPEPVFRDAVFPTKIQTVETYTDPRGRRQRLVLVVGQFASDPALAPGHGRQRNFTQVGARVYYAPPSATDFTPAQFGLVQGSRLGSQAAFSAQVSDLGGTGVKRVLVGYHDGSAWKFVDLQPSANPALWTGGGPTTTPDPEFFVQAVDGAGNVSVTSYKGRYYLAPPPPPPSGGLAWSFAGTPGENGWFKSAVTGTVTAPDDAELNLDGGPFGLSSPLTITGDGIHLVGIRLHDQLTNVPVGIDATAPTITVTRPLAGGTVRASDGTLAAFSCDDAGAGVATCTATLNGSPVANGADISRTLGANTLIVTAIDAAGNSATRSVAFTVQWPFTGFLIPVKNPPLVNRIVPGWIIPVRFNLGGYRGLGIFAAGSPTLTTTTCPPSATTWDVNETTAGPPGGAFLVYNPFTQNYLYIWKTPTAWPSGQCRLLTMKLVDGTTRTAIFKAR
jgi:hypothetical protein